MLESTEEKKTGIIETVMGIIGDVSGKKPKFQIHYRPIDSDGKSIIPKEKVPEPVYDKQGNLQMDPSSRGDIVDIEV